MSTKKGLSQEVANKAPRDKFASSKSDKQIQGEITKGRSASESRIKRLPRTQTRGPGSAYANVVPSLDNQGKDMRDSQSGFLGKDSKVLNPSDQVQRDLLYKGKK